MKGFMFQADLWCEKCGEDLIRGCLERGLAPDDDSDTWPKEVDVSEEADTPLHCGSGMDCLDPSMVSDGAVGKFFENSLTTEGVEYVKEAVRDAPGKVALELWAPYYGIDRHWWVTPGMFDTALYELVEKRGVNDLMDIPGVYKLVREELNNEVLEALEAEERG